jgi:thiamine biosynthesis lipoprotein
LNQAHGVAVPLEREWLDLLQRVQGQSRQTGGAFDPLLWPLIQAWGLREGGLTPSETRLRQARQASGVQWLRLDPEKGTAQLLHAAAGIEEGGFGKGYALDRAAKTAKGSGATSGLLDFGGQLLAFGKTQTVSLSDPTDRLRPRLSLVLHNASLASSGTSEKGGHILNPKTGRPCPTWGSVAVIAPSGLEADCLSTALYVMGPRQGLRWATVHQIPVCFLLNNRQIRMSPAFRALAPTTL